VGEEEAGTVLVLDAAGGDDDDDVTTCKTEGGEVSDPDSWSGLLPTDEEDDALSATGESLSEAPCCSGSSVAPEPSCVDEAAYR